MTRDSFAPAHLAETVLKVQGDARMIFWEYTRLERPDAAVFRSPDQSAHQRAADADAARRRRDIDADFRHTGVGLALRNRAQRGPAQNYISVSGHQAAIRQMAVVPALPVRRFGFKSGLPGRYAFEVN